MSHVDQIIKKLVSPTEADKKLIQQAYDFAEKAHHGKKRYSGDPFVTHLVAVATKLAEMGMGTRTIAAGLIHDSIEDTEVTAADVKELFGEEIFFLVDGVTKLGSVRYYGSDRHNESLRKLFVATSQDIRVLIIKLVDRLHNMETLQYVPKEKQERIARETLEIYVPVAHRLGMGRIRKELEDLAFPYVYPKEYEKVTSLVQTFAKKSAEELEKARKTLQKKLVEAKLNDFRTSTRIKGTYSLYQKLKRKEWDIDNVYDYLAIRIVVPSIEDCYRTLGIVHELWRPLPQRVKDYIAFPKPNGYQSIHTTVITSGGTIIEIQIRTEQMHLEAEFGIASHMAYKDTTQGTNKTASPSWFGTLVPLLFRPFSWKGKKGEEPPEELIKERPHREKIPLWIRDIGSSYGSEDGSTEFVEGLKNDFFSYRIFVFTPEGDVVDLPVGASPIDFAYAIHSEVGNHTSGAKVNNKLVGLDTRLKNGDIVEIIKKESSKPTAKWLEYARTSLAQRRIRTAIGLGDVKIKQ